MTTSANSEDMGGQTVDPVADPVRTPQVAPTEPEPGQTVYSREGLRAEYVTALDGSHIVRPWVVITSWDGEDEYSQPAGLDVWPEVFPEAPVAVLEAEIVSLQGEIDAKRRELAVATDEAAGFIRDERERLARIKRHEDLARLDDYLAGKISHVVKIGYGSITVHEFKDIAKVDDRYDREGLKLLTLFGKPGCGLQWQLNHYSDGSGSNVEVVPCSSHEEALSIASVRLGEVFARAGEERAYWLGEAIKSAEALGLAVPDAARERFRHDRLKELAERKSVEQTAIDKINAEIAALAPDGAASRHTPKADEAERSE